MAFVDCNLATALQTFPLSSTTGGIQEFDYVLLNDSVNRQSTWQIMSLCPQQFRIARRVFIGKFSRSEEVWTSLSNAIWK